MLYVIHMYIKCGGEILKSARVFHRWMQQKFFSESLKDQIKFQYVYVF